MFNMPLPRGEALVPRYVAMWIRRTYERALHDRHAQHSARNNKTRGLRAAVMEAYDVGD
jgi:hypothetical protein